MVACYRSHPAGEAGIPETGGRNPDCRAYSASDDHLSIHFGHGAGGLRWLYATESPPFCGARTHAHGDLASVAAAATMHVLEVSGVTAPRGCAATVDRPATDAATSVGTIIAETREYIGGELRNGDRPSGWPSPGQTIPMPSLPAPWSPLLLVSYYGGRTFNLGVRT